MFPGTYLHEGNLSSGLQAGEVPALVGEKQLPLSALPRAHPWLALPAFSLEGSPSAVNAKIWPASLILSMAIFLWHVHILDTLS